MIAAWRCPVPCALSLPPVSALGARTPSTEATSPAGMSSSTPTARAAIGTSSIWSAVLRCACRGAQSASGNHVRRVRPRYPHCRPNTSAPPRRRKEPGAARSSRSSIPARLRRPPTDRQKGPAASTPQGPQRRDRGQGQIEVSKVAALLAHKQGRPPAAPGPRRGSIAGPGLISIAVNRPKARARGLKKIKQAAN